MNKVQEGWGKSPVSRKWHWFLANGFSLCGKVGFYFGHVEQGKDNSPDNCAACKKRLAKRHKLIDKINVTQKRQTKKRAKP